MPSPASQPQPFSAASALPFYNALRALNPVVQCLTNDVVQAFTANALLAIGASPAMVVAEEEAPGFAALADAVLINVGTVQAPLAKSMLLAAAAARAHGTPWVLDPVALGVLPYRAGVVNELLQHRPTAIRGNAAEILFMAGRASQAKGADSLDSAHAALEAAQELAARQDCIVAVTGEVDYVTDGKRTLAVYGGHVNLTRVTGAGCSLSAMVAAFMAHTEPDRLDAAASACLLMKTAGQAAAKSPMGSAGLGSFAVALLDGLSLPPDQLLSAS